MTMPVQFGATSTTDDVLSSLELSGQRILVTGVSAGIGVETARALAARGARVVGTARNLEKAQATTEQARAQVASGGGLELIELDLASLASVRRCADTLLLAGESFDIIIANAGLMAGPKLETVDGFEAQFATNYLGHFVLVNRIADLLKSGGRVVMVSSAGHRRADIDLEDPNFNKTPYNEFIAYGRSKTATILFAVEFNRRYKPRGIHATAIHPGAIQTETVKTMIEALGDRKDAAVAAYDWKTVAQGAATSVWAGCIATTDEIGARYCEDCHVAEVNDDPAAKTGVRSYALDPTRAKALWAKAEEMTGERFSVR
jgi:NAD(P)-dependent dehydrogenase (short-subunit alcohol dehydrogenase family)